MLRYSFWGHVVWPHDNFLRTQYYYLIATLLLLVQLEKLLQESTTKSREEIFWRKDWYLLHLGW